MGRRGRRRKQLLDDLKETTGNFKLKEEAIDRTLEKLPWNTCRKTPYPLFNKNQVPNRKSHDVQLQS
jgi:hypothetical protein